MSRQSPAAMDPLRHTLPPVVSFPVSNPNADFTFTPANPNPGFFRFATPNPNVPHSFGILPPLPPVAPPTALAPNIREAASLLKTLINRAEKTFREVSDFLRLEEPVDRDDLGVCPFNCHHKMPPESLFLHTLRCPSAPGIVEVGDLPTLKYRNFQRPESECSSVDQFFGGQEDSSGDLHFSLDEDAGYNANFFYRDCPGVVGPSNNASVGRIFTIPRILFAEGGVNFRSVDLSIHNQSHSMLPSEFWDLKCELDGWTDYPVKISRYGLRASSCISHLKRADSRRWIISNSPSHGIVVDAAMSEHLFILLKFCLRAFLRDVNRCLKENIDDSYYNCPAIFESLTWLGSQLSIVYGQVKGKDFAINMVRSSLLTVANGVLLFQMPNVCEIEAHCRPDGAEAGLSAGTDVDVKIGGKGREGDVYVSHVAAAVSALFERASLEERIKGLHPSPMVPKFQLLSEHARLSRSADELRVRRSDYRPIIEHDGCLYQRPHDQDGRLKVKTHEEILAEERDYKRRRMSYRGKKTKRTPVQVLRDIIEEHMDEIVKAGGIGCFVKSVADNRNSAAQNITTEVKYAYTESQNNVYCASGMSEIHSRDDTEFVNNNRYVLYRQDRVCFNNDQVNMDYNEKGTSNKQENDDHTLEYRSHIDVHKTHRTNKVGQSHGSRSPHCERSNIEHFGRHEQRKKQDQTEVYRIKDGHRGGNYSRTEYEHDVSHSSSRPRISTGRRYTQKTESEGRYDSRKHKAGSSKSRTQDILEDRYNPSDSYDTENYGYDYSRNEFK